MLAQPLRRFVVFLLSIAIPLSLAGAGAAIIIPIKAAKAASGFSLIVDDSFQRADTAFGSSADTTPVGSPATFNSPSTGGAWIDYQGNNFEIYGNAVLGITNGGPPLDALYRPAAENYQNGMARAFMNAADGGGSGLLARFNPAGGGSGYSGYFLQNGTSGGYAYLYKAVNGVKSTLFSAVPFPTFSLPSSYIFEFQAINTDASTVQITFNIYDQAAPNVVVGTRSFTDTDPNLQAAGAWGMASAGNTLYHRVQTFQAVTGGPVVAGNASLQSVYKTHATLTAGPSTGGAGALSYQWYRSTTAGFTPSSATLLSGATTTALSDSGLAPGTSYYYALVTTDQTAPTPQASQSNYVSATTLPASSHVLGFIGDSITYGAGATTPAPNVEANSLNASGYGVTPINRGVIGTTTAQWQPGGNSYFDQALAAFQASDVDAVQLMLGTNDARDGAGYLLVTPAQYGTNMQNIVSALTSAGLKVVVNYQPYVTPGSFSGAWDASSDTALQGYQARIDGLVNGTTVLAGAKNTFTFFQAHQGELSDGVHPTQQGYSDLGSQWAAAFQANFAPATAPPSFSSAATSADGTQVVVTLLAPSGLPILPAAGIAGFTLSGGHSVTSASRTAPAQVTLSVSPAIRHGETLTSSYAPGNVTDSAGTPNALAAFTARPVTNGSTLASSYALTGPGSGPAQQASVPFTVQAAGSLNGPVTVTPSDGGAGGSFSPASVTLAAGTNGSATFAYTPSTAGPKNISVTNTGSLTDPANLAYTASMPLATAYLVSGPASGIVNQSSTAFTLTLQPAGSVPNGAVTITPAVSGVTGTFSQSALTVTQASPSASFTFTPTGAGTAAVSFTNSGNLTDPAPLAYVASSPAIGVTGVAVTATAAAVTVNWTTALPTSSQLAFGPTSSYGATTNEADTSPRVTGHTASFAAAGPCLTYHYQVTSRDQNANAATSSDMIVTTPCVGSAAITASAASDPLVPAAGGTLALTDGGSHGLTLAVPANAVSGSTVFEAHQLDPAAVLRALPLPAGSQAVGPYVYDLKAVGTTGSLTSTFSRPLSLTLAYDPAQVPAGADPAGLKLYRSDGGAWTPLSDSSVNTSAHTVTASTGNFSTFALLASIPATGTASPSPSAAAPADSAGSLAATGSDTRIATIFFSGLASLGAVGLFISRRRRHNG